MAMSDTPRTSPFPGMDPYLEMKWPEVHARLIVYASNHLNAQLPADLPANIEENLAVRYADHSQRPIRPDVNITEEAETIATGYYEGSSVAIAQPVVVPIAPCPERHIAIVNSSGQVITAIEFLSPWNKIGQKGRTKYVTEQLEYLATGINLVEIDLVRQGEYILPVPPLSEENAKWADCLLREQGWRK